MASTARPVPTGTVDLLTMTVGDDGGLLIDAFVTTADVPAPAALALFGLGLIGLGAARRRG
jgi:hypothetical protein